MNLIVAVDNNWAIGNKNELLVRIPNDHKHFREETTGKVVVLGRKTLETFPQGLPLKNRTNIILSRDTKYQVKDAVIVHSIEELLEELKDTHGLSFIFICHNLALVQSFCDKVLVLYDGKVVESGKPDSIINEPKEAYTKKLVDAVFE